MLKKFNSSRTVFGAFHILKGKKSAQTIQDSRIFDLTKLFGVYKDLNRETVHQVIKVLVENKFVTTFVEDDHRYIVTQAGNEFLNSKLQVYPIPCDLNGFLYRDVTETFWRRLALITQCLSHLTRSKHEFIPIIKEVHTQLWVKRKLTSQTMSTNQLASALHQEIKTVLMNTSTQEATLFVLRLSGIHRIGLTVEQASLKLQIDEQYAKLLFNAALHGIIDNVIQNKVNYPVLYSLLDHHSDNNVLTETAQKTMTLIKRGFSIVEIAQIRNLKQNTIEDHVVEIAMNDNEFSIDTFVSEDEQNKIQSVINDIGTKRLKEIKNRLDKEISYFSIRLTLARREAENECK